MLSVVRMASRARQLLSTHASVCLVALVIPIGLTAGFGFALERIASLRSEPTSELGGGTAAGAKDSPAICAHAALEFEAYATAAAIRDLLLALEARVIYGPDEFGRFQVRLASGATGRGMHLLSTSALVMQLESFPACP